MRGSWRRWPLRLRQEQAELNARVAVLSAEVDRLQERVTTLSGLLFGSSSEKRAPAARGGRGGETAARRGRPGAGSGGSVRARRGHGRRGYAHLETEERVIDLEPAQRCCAAAGSRMSSSAPRTAS